MQTLLVGLDAASPGVLRQLREEAVVPTLESLLTRGASGPLRSQIPPWTASAWPSIYTGKNPGKHGVFGFLHFDGYDWDVVNATHVREPTVWELLDRHGYRSVVVNAPVTHPPRAFDGALVPGYAAPEEPACHPDGLFEELTDAIGEYRIYAPDDVTGDEQVEWYERLVGMRGEAFRYLAATYDPDFGFVQFQQTDTVFHERPGDFDAVEAVYAAVDAELSAILDECDPENVIVASDHGIGRYRGTECRVNELLRDAGFVAGKRGGEGMPTWTTVRDSQLKEGSTSDGDGPGAAARAVAALSRVGLTTERIAAALEAVGLADAVARHVPLEVSRAGTEQVDFPASRAYVRDRIELGVRINLEGREPDGTVPPEEYESVRRELVETLSAVETPAGEPLFEDVAPREEYFHGDAADEAVDVVTVPADFEHLLSSNLGDPTFDSLDGDWHHKPEGVIAATGPAVDAADGVGDAQLFDVAPTVLAAFDVPYGDRMDGDPLRCVESGGTAEYARADERATVETDDEYVEQRLADLGYIE